MELDRKPAECTRMCDQLCLGLMLVVTDKDGKMVMRDA